MKSTTYTFLTFAALWLLPALLQAQTSCAPGQTQYSYCYGYPEESTVGMEVCPDDPSATVEAIFAQGELINTGGFNYNVTVYEGAQGSGATGQLKGTFTGTFTNQVVTSAQPGNCLIYVFNIQNDFSFAASCQDTGNDPITVCAGDVGGTAPTFSAPNDLCINAGVQSGLGGGTPTGGVYSGPGVIDGADGETYTFDPTVAGAGTKTLTYTVNGTPITDEVEVVPVPMIAFSALSDLCIDAGVQTNLGGGSSPAGGSFSGPGVTDNGDGTYDFDPVVAGLGMHTITYTEPGLCMATATDQVEVTAACGCPAGQETFFYCYGNNLNQEIAFEICPDAGMAIEATVQAGSIGLNFGDDGDQLEVYRRQNGASGLGTLQAGPLTGDLSGQMFSGLATDACLVFVITSGGLGSCVDPAPFGKETPLQVCATSAASSLSFIAPADFCITDGLQTGLSGGSPAGGVYSGTGVVDNADGTYNLDPAIPGPGLLTITYTVGGNMVSDNVEIFAADAATFTAPSDLCIDAGVLLNQSGGSPAGGTFSGPGVTDNGNGTYAFNPAGAGLGVHTITYTEPGGCMSTATDQIEVLAACGCPAGEESFFYCTSNNEPGTIAFEVCPDAGKAAEATIAQLTLTPDDQLEVYEGMPGSGTSGSLVFGPQNGNLAGEVITGSNLGQCLIFVVATGPAGSCQDGIDLPLKVCGRSITPTVQFMAPDDFSISLGTLSNLGGGTPQGGEYSGDGVVDNGDGLTYSLDPTVNGVGPLTITYSVGGESASDIVNILGPLPAFTQAFSPSTIGVGESSRLVFTIDNTGSSPLGELAFVNNLPAGLAISPSPALETDCTGAVLSAPAGGSTITFSEGAVGAASSCTVSVNVAGSAAGVYANTSSDLTSASGNIGPSSATLTIDSNRPALSKAFADATLEIGQRTTLTLTIDNSNNTGIATSITFTDHLPSGLRIASPANLITDCSTVSFTAEPGSSSISTAPASNFLLSGQACSVSVDVEAIAAGVQENVTSNLTYSPGGPLVTSGTATASLTVNTPGQLAISQSFLEDPIPPGGTVDLSFTISNFDRNFSASAIGFTEDLDAILPGLQAVNTPLLNPCGAGSMLSGTSTLSFSGGNLAAESTCTFTVTLQVPAGAAPGSYPASSSNLTGTINGSPFTGAPATDALFINYTPQLAKSFTPSLIGTGQAFDMEFTLTNTSPDEVFSGGAFTDELSAFLGGVTMTTPSLNNVCNGIGTVFYISSNNSISVLNLELQPGASCTFTVPLLAPENASAGVYTNTTSTVSGTLGGVATSGPAATAALTVLSAPTLSKSFVNAPALSGGQVDLAFTIAYSAEAMADVNNITFTDNLDAVIAGLAPAGGLPASDVCGAGSMLSFNSGELTLTGGQLSPGNECSFTVTLDIPAGTADGSYTNTTSSLQADVMGTAVSSSPASDELLITGLSFAKSFANNSVIAGGSTLMTLTIDNTGSLDATALSFTDNLTDFMPGATVSNSLPASFCGGTLSEVGGQLIFSGGSAMAGSSCVISLTLNIPAETADGSYTNTTSELSATVDGNTYSLLAAQASLEVNSTVIGLEKTFSTAAVAAGSTIDLTYTLSNISEEPLNNISFTEDYGAALSGMALTAAPTAGSCTGAMLSGTSMLSFSGGALPAMGSCTFTVTLQVPAGAPSSTNVITTTSPLTGEASGLPVMAPPATASFSIEGLLLTKSFLGGSIEAGSTGTLSFTLENLDTGNPIADLRFTDDLDAVLTGLVALNTPLSDVCGAGSSLSGTSLLTLQGGNLPAGGSCTFTVEVSVPCNATPGSYTNTTSTVSSGGLDAGGPATAMLTVAPETTPPSITCPADVDVDCGSDTSVPALGNATATDNCTNSPTLSSMDSFLQDCGAAGTITRTFTATDQNNNSNSCTQIITIVDNAAPSVSCPSDINVNNAPGLCGAEVSFTASAMDNCGTATVSFDHAPGFFSVGTTMVTATATDECGLTATCSFTVTVTDNEQPNAVCQNSTVFIQPDGTYELQLGDVLDLMASSDNCGIANSSIPPTAFDCDDFGQTFSIMAQVSDAAGNIGSCTAQVTVDKGGTLPAGWQGTNIGTAPQGNTYSFDPCTQQFDFSSSANHQIFGAADNLAFLNQEFCGNGAVEVRLTDLTGQGYIGLMLREDASPGSRYVGAFSNFSTVIRVENRLTPNTPKQARLLVRPQAVWLKMERQGSLIRLFTRTENGSYQLSLQLIVNFPECISAGIALFSTQPGTTVSGDFDAFSITGSGANLIAPDGSAPQGDNLAPELEMDEEGNVLLHWPAAAPQPYFISILDESGQPLQQRQLQTGQRNMHWPAGQLPEGAIYFRIETANGAHIEMEQPRQ